MRNPKFVAQKLRSEDENEVKGALLYLHRQVFQQLKHFVLGANGQMEDAEDVFQEGLFIFLKKARQDDLPENLNPESYLYTICKNYWLKTLAKKKKTVPIPEYNNSVFMAEDTSNEILQKEKTKVVRGILNQLGGSCQKMLLYFYYEKKKMKKIATLMGFANEQVAKNKKNRCMKKLREIVFSGKQNKEWFRD